MFKNSGNRGINLLSKVIPFPQVREQDAVDLSELLKDEELADFFRYVDRNDLRAEALELLEKRLGE